MRDLPSGPALLALARDVLLDDLMPLVPQDHRLDILLIANCMAIAQREAEADGSVQTIVNELEMMYERSEAAPALPHRFARDLRIGAFENSEPLDRDARAILWRLTVAKLRNANPRFLAANGFG